jgi:hypothetical protein
MNAMGCRSGFARNQEWRWFGGGRFGCRHLSLSAHMHPDENRVVTGSQLLGAWVWCMLKHPGINRVGANGLQRDGSILSCRGS